MDVSVWRRRWIARVDVVSSIEESDFERFEDGEVWCVDLEDDDLLVDLEDEDDGVLLGFE